jgi:CubicO group peptidase (beta-lactamase class C family)
LSDQTRELPDQPNLRFLKLEAKRRLAAGEFATLHDAQLAVAREHGLSSWAVLKETVTADEAGQNPALGHLRWLIARFRDADGGTWVPPADEEMGEHFTREFLSAVPPETGIDTLTKTAASFREELVVIGDIGDYGVRAEIGGLRVEALVEADPPHRLTYLLIYPLSRLITDERVTAPPAVAAGRVPAEAMELARESFTELGVPSLIMAGVGGDSAWSLALGWANLDLSEPLGLGHRFPAYVITGVITATAVLRMVADGLVELDAPANRYLRTVRLASEEVTVRELLSHTAAVDNPDPRTLSGGAITDLLSLVGPVMACSGPRGKYRCSLGGSAVLGQLIADVTGAPYQDTAESLVLRPLGMTDSFFPESWPERDTVTGYQLEDDGRFKSAPRQFCVIPAMAGLWSTAADLARFGAAWGSLLPAELAAEAVRPQAGPPGDNGPGCGLGWPLAPGGNLAGLVGGASGMNASLLTVPGSGRATVTMTGRMIGTAIEQLNARLLGPNA